LDSGILYRRLSAVILKKKIKLKDNEINKFLKTIKFLSPKRHSSLRREKIGSKASQIAKILLIRTFINKQQYLIVSKILKTFKGCVIDGRDIGSKVFKNAQIKLYIDVNLEIRAQRRHKQLIANGEKSIYTRILRDLKLRDKADKGRKISPLKIPIEAFIIDNSYSFKFTCNQINAIIKAKNNLY